MLCKGTLNFYTFANYILHNVAYRPVARQRPQNKQGDNSCCYAMTVRQVNIQRPFQSNGLVNTLLWKRGVFYVAHAEML
jgi:hypothetical protein